MIPDPAPLFTPFTCKQLNLKNRIVMAPMTRSFSPRGIPGPNVVEYYRKRAEGGAGLLITEGTYIGDPCTYADPSVPHFSGSEPLAAWRAVVEAVHAAGARIMPQLWHVGLVEVRVSSLDRRSAYRPELGLVGPSGILWPDRQVTAPLSEHQIQRIIEAYAQAAADAQETGFDGVEIHAGHGYLIDQFFWEHTNRRTDRYGGSLENRGRFAGEIVTAMRHRVGADFPIVLRVSQWKQQDYTARLADRPEDLLRLLQPAIDAGVSILHGSQRRFWEPEFAGSDLNLAGWLRKLTGLPAITVGSVGLSSEFVESLVGREHAAPAGLDRLMEMFARGDFDLVAVGRALIADPHWPEKLKCGRLDQFGGFSAEALAELR